MLLQTMRTDQQQMPRRNPVTAAAEGYQVIDPDEKAA